MDGTLVIILLNQLNINFKNINFRPSISAHDLLGLVVIKNIIIVV